MKIGLELEVSRIGYVLYRNGMNPVINATAEAGEDLRNVVFTVRSDPPFIVEDSFKIDGLASGTRLDLREHMKISLDPSLLISAADAVPCRVTLEASLDDGSSESEFCDTEVLPFEFWPGFEYPDLVASFVTPNAERLTDVRASASDILKEWGMDPSLEGYQGDRDRVAAMAAAVYVAIQRMNVSYVVAPAGFETSGQRVRLPDVVVSSKEGTCLDMSVLYCSVLESIGINAFVFLFKGHACAGFWLVDEHMADTVSVDSSAITRLIRNHDACAVECTFMCAPGNTPFDDACKNALDRLDDADSFISAVDVRKSRASISPLPTRRFDNGIWTVDRDESSGASAAPRSVGQVYEEIEDRTLTRVDLWKRELLDTTSRNPLVNMKVGAKAVPLLVSDVAAFEDMFSEGGQFTILSKPQDWNGSKIYEERPFETEAYVCNYENAYRDEVARGWVRTPLGEADTTASLKSIYRLYKKEMEESGCNSLFVTVGVLRWYEMKGDKIPRYSPLILIPAELIKKQKGYTVVRFDEESVFNVTLAEKLRQEYEINIPGIDPLPLDEQGVNVDRITQNVRRCIEGQEGWEVLDGAALGVFSFSQYAMWVDIDRNIDRLRENPVVDALVSGSVYHADAELDADADPYGLCLTVAADGSQIKAVRAAGEGKTFVMHGPPGTGKSQTITNLITNAMYQGKTVLFVAEKRAALEVVQKRLDGIGVGNHCLELHSDKTEKTKVLEQLRKAMEPAKEYDAAKLDDAIANLNSMRIRLDAYVTDLHKRREWGFSAYECISRYEAYDSSKAKDLRISPDTALSMRPETLGELEDDLLKAHQAYGIAQSMCDTGALESIHADVLAASLQFDIEEAMDDVARAAEEMEAVGKEMAASGIPVDPLDAEATKRLLKAIGDSDGEMASNPDLMNIPGKSARIASLLDDVFLAFRGMDPMDARADAALRLRTDAETLVSLLDDAESNGWIARADAVRNAAVDVSRCCSEAVAMRSDMDKVSSQWRPGVYEFDQRYGIQRSWNEANGKMLFKGGAKKKFISDVSPVLKNPGADFDSLSGTVKLISAVSSKLSELKRIAGSVEKAKGAVDDLRTGLNEASSRAAAAIVSAEAAGMEPSELAKAYGNAESSKAQVDRYMAASEEWEKARDRLAGITKTDADLSTVGKCSEYCEAVRPHLGGIFDWANWNYYASKLTSEGLGSACDAIKSGMDADAVVCSSYRSIYKTMINICRQESESLRMFNAPTFEGLIAKFKKTDASYTEINKNILKYRLYKNVPRNMDSSVPDSEAGKLYKAINGSRMKKSIRTLLSEIPHMLPRLCPCLLMSPQSVSQYITMDYPKFDLVVFDESSQITTSKAVGALGRAKAAVVAGDREQLPPTRFFQKKIEADEGEEEIEDMESFLEDCLALNMPQTYLEWHYRSTHESLIAFSNKMFYDGKMMTFPSPNDQETRVSMRFVEGGVYEKRRRYNQVEAAAVVDEIYRRVMDPKYDGTSIGVIAFSISQQNCIEDALDERTAKDSKFFAKLNKMPEDMFIKNLETVQGDERDLILFSIGYGPSKDGVVAQSFGPINRAGGGRRLNVAVSRARKEMIVFSSMRYTSIKLTPSSSNGVRGMKEFLRFAENGGRFGDQDHSKPVEGESRIIEDISEALRSYGYESHYGVGNSGFKVDLAVIDPDDPEEYILGILDDGDSYKASENTRDREFARADVLVRMGWNIIHVWSVDWFFSKKQTLKRILDRIEEIRRSRVEAPEPEKTETVEKVPEPVPEEASEPVPKDVPDPVPEPDPVVPDEDVPEEPDASASDEPPGENPPEEDVGYFPEEDPEDLPASPQEPERDDFGKIPYVPYVPKEFDVPMEVAIADREAVKRIAGDIITAESPITEEHLLALYRKSAKIKRLMEQKRSVLVANIRGLYPPEIRGDFVTYWAYGADRNIRTYRVAESTSDSRDISAVPLKELLNACADVVEVSVSIPRNVCVSAVGKALGYKRAGANVISTVEKALDIALEDGLVIERNGDLMMERGH